MEIAIAAIIGALIHRFRGGWPSNPLPGRSLFYSTAIILAISWFAFEPLTAVLIAVLYLFGGVFGWASYMDCGASKTDKSNVAWIDKTLAYLFNPDKGVARDCVGMALRGLLYLPMLLVIPVLFRSWEALPFVAVLILFAPTYGISQFIARKTKTDALAIAEPLVGGVFGAALMAQWIFAT